MGLMVARAQEKNTKKFRRGLNTGGIAVVPALDEREEPEEEFVDPDPEVLDLEPALGFIALCAQGEPWHSNVEPE